MSYNSIKKCYKEDKFPNAYCLLLNQSDSDTIIIRENIKTFNKERSNKNGK